MCWHFWVPAAHGVCLLQGRPKFKSTNLQSRPREIGARYVWFPEEEEEEEEEILAELEKRTADAV
jgi:hypothetical protein